MNLTLVGHRGITHAAPADVHLARVLGAGDRALGLLAAHGSGLGHVKVSDAALLPEINLTNRC